MNLCHPFISKSMKFNAKLGRLVTYNHYPEGKFEVVSINQDGTLNLERGTWLVTNVKVKDVCRRP